MKKNARVSRWVSALTAALLLALCLPTGAYAAGEAVALQVAEPVWVGNLAELSITSMAEEPVTDGKFVVLYDATMLEYVSTEAGDAWTGESGALEYADNVTQPGRVVVAFAAENAAGEGSLFDLSFRALTAGEITFSLGDGSYLTGSGEVRAAVTVQVYAMPQDPVPGGSDLCDGGVDCPSRRFTDVDTSLWYHHGVDYVVSNGLMVGTSGSTFSPGLTTTRGMLVTILYRMEGSPAVSGEMAFTDVEEGSYYYDAVLWADENGITNGMGSSTIFAPNYALTREQIVTFLWRYAAYTGRDVSGQADLSGFRDNGSIQSYARQAMAWAVSEEIVYGMPGSTIQPQGPATRAQMAVMIYRFATE